jgi:hypothetical protein
MRTLTPTLSLTRETETTVGGAWDRRERQTNACFPLPALGERVRVRGKQVMATGGNE